MRDTIVHVRSVLQSSMISSSHARKVWRCIEQIAYSTYGAALNVVIKIDTLGGDDSDDRGDSDGDDSDDRGDSDGDDSDDRGDDSCCVCEVVANPGARCW